MVFLGDGNTGVALLILLVPASPSLRLTVAA